MPRLSPLALTGGLVLAATLSFTACASPAPAQSGASVSMAPVSSQQLLEKTTATVLQQQLRYPNSSQAQISSSIITLAPGAETGLHRHDAPMYAYILDGELTVTYDGGTIKTYRAGQAVMEAEGTAHNGKNSGTTPVRVLVVNMGADGVANTVTLP